MNHSPAQIIAVYLTEDSGSLFTAPGDSGEWPLYIGTMPDNQEQFWDAGAVFDTSGERWGRLMDGEEIFSYGFQVLVRSREYQDGWGKIHDVMRLLATLHGEEIMVEGTSYLIDSIRHTTTPLRMGQDEKRRYLFSLNGLVSFR